MKGGVHLSIVPKLNVSGIKGLRLFFQGKTNVNEYAIREFGIRKGLKKLVISSKIRVFIGENQ